MITSEIKRVSLPLCSGYKYLYSSCAGGGGLRSCLGAGATLEEWGCGSKPAPGYPVLFCFDGLAALETPVTSD